MVSAVCKEARKTVKKGRASCQSDKKKVESKVKRVRYKVPTYKKADKINKNIKEYQCNQKHIFRYKSLQRTYSLIAYEVFQGQLKLFFGEWRLIKDGLVIYFEEQGNQAEIQGTELLPIGERLKIHIKLLRQLRQGVKVKKAVKIARKAGKWC